MSDGALLSLNLREARRLALRAQGLLRAHPSQPKSHHVLGVVDRLGLVQIDSVNVLARAHYLPAYSRLGPYETKLLDRAAWAGRRKLFEYWGHEASLLPVATQPLMRWRMTRASRGTGTWGNLARFADEYPARVRETLAEITDRGPLAAADLQNAGKSKGPWWGWSDGKLALEYLFWSGQVGITARRGAFERVYDLPSRFLPPEILALPTPPEAEAQRKLVGIAAKALGVATAADLGAYFRLSPTDSRSRVAELVEAGELVPATVEGWRSPAFLTKGEEAPARAAGRCFLSPFDPLIFERDRTERLFGFRYRIEIYTPAHKREHGYYVLPFLLKDRLVARVDLKADRIKGRLVVAAAHSEPGLRPEPVAEAMRPELGALAAWLALPEIRVDPKGNLAQHLTDRIEIPSATAV